MILSAVCALAWQGESNTLLDGLIASQAAETRLDMCFVAEVIQIVPYNLCLNLVSHSGIGDRPESTVCTDHS